MIEVRKIAKTLADGFTIGPVSLSLDKGGTIVLTGPSGCGKTTLLRLIAGLEAPDSGEIYIDGKLVSSSGKIIEPHLRGIGFVFQSHSLWPHLNVAGNIIFGLDGTVKKKKFERLRGLIDALELTGLEKRFPDQISNGEARRVSIARTLAPEPKRLLLDEALTNLDHELKLKISGLLRSEREKTGASMIYVTHILDEVDLIGGARYYMENGRLVDKPTL